MNRSKLGLAIFLATLLLASCGGAGAPSAESVIRDYYAAIEADDAEAAVAFFADDAKATVPSGTVFEGPEIPQFISFDIDFMASVEFTSDFSESDGEVTWTQDYTNVDGDVWQFRSVARVEDGKIVEWTLTDQ